MTDLMSRELEAVFYMLAAGMAVKLLFQGGNLMLKRVESCSRLKHILYLFIWLAAAYLFGQFLYKATYGMITWYTLAAFATGCILWKKIFCGILNLSKNAQIYNGNKEYEEKNKRES